MPNPDGTPTQQEMLQALMGRAQPSFSGDPGMNHQPVQPSFNGDQGIYAQPNGAPTVPMPTVQRPNVDPWMIAQPSRSFSPDVARQLMEMTGRSMPGSVVPQEAARKLQEEYLMKQMGPPTYAPPGGGGNPYSSLAPPLKTPW